MFKFQFGRKNVPLFIITLIILVYVIVTSIDGLLYFFKKDGPKDLGEAVSMNMEVFSTLQDGDFVQIKGITSIHGGALNKGFLSQKHIIFYIAGSNKFIVTEKADESGKFEGPQLRTIQGKVRSFKTDKHAAKMRDFFAKSFMLEMDADGFLIESGVVPGKDYGPVVIFGIVVLLLIVSVTLFIRSIRTDTDLTENEEDDI